MILSGFSDEPEDAVNNVCNKHGFKRLELKDYDIAHTFGPRLIFYCPVSGCDRFVWESRKGVSTIFEIAEFFLAENFMKLYKIERELKPSREEVAMITQLFKNAVRLKILFYKQRLFIDDGK